MFATWTSSLWAYLHPPSAALGSLRPLARGTASPLCCSGFYFIVLTPLNLHSYLQAK